VTRFAGGLQPSGANYFSRLGFWWDAGLALLAQRQGCTPESASSGSGRNLSGPSRQVRVVHEMAEHLDNWRGSLKHHQRRQLLGLWWSGNRLTAKNIQLTA
jgi:hypothetical protein